MNASKIDCIVVGHNETSFDDHVTQQRAMSATSGGYREVKHNTVFSNDKRMGYMELMNRALTGATGQNISLSSYDVPNYAVCYLTSYLRRRGMAAEPVNQFQTGKSRLRDLLISGARSVAISTTYYFEAGPVSEIVSFAKSVDPTVKTIAGGPFIFKIFDLYDAATREILFDQIGADIYVVDSQGEESLSRLLTLSNLDDSVQLSRIPNLVIRDGARYRETSRKAENNSLDKNVVDWKHFDTNLLHPMVTTRTARSCPFRCAYCRYHLVAGEYCKMDLEILRRELSVLNRIGTKHVYFLDDTFNVPAARIRSICELIKQERFSFSWSCYARSSTLEDDIPALMAESGCIAVCIGAESGDDGILKNMNKKSTVKQNRSAIKRFMKTGIFTYPVFIVGFPGETADTIRRTADLIEDTSPSCYFAHLYFHDPWTPIQSRAKEFGLKGSYYGWRHNTMNWEEAADRIDKLFKTISSSTVLPLSTFTFQTLPYLFGRGIPRNSVEDFLGVAHQMLIKSLDDQAVDLGCEEQDLISVLKKTPFALEITGEVERS